MKKILILFLSLSLFWACNSESSENEELGTEENNTENVNLEEDLGELEEELNTKKDSLKE
jgi:hypothetical protein